MGLKPYLYVSAVKANCLYKINLWEYIILSINSIEIDITQSANTYRSKKNGFEHLVSYGSPDRVIMGLGQPKGLFPYRTMIVRICYSICYKKITISVKIQG